MTGFTGKSFLLGMSHLDGATRQLFSTHGKALDGRFNLVEQIVDDAMLRLAGADVYVDADGRDRTR